MDTATYLMVENTARELATFMIAAARHSAEPVVFVTGNSFVPPLRSFEQAEEIYQHPGNDQGELFGALAEMLDNLLDTAYVYLGNPEYDNALYVVDLKRFQFTENAAGDSLNDEWSPI